MKLLNSKKWLLLPVIIIFIFGLWHVFDGNQVVKTSPNYLVTEEKQHVGSGESANKLPEGKPVLHESGQQPREPMAVSNSNNEIVKEYQKRYLEIKKKLKNMDFDYRAMSQELQQRLKESEDGKLSREEILELFPPEIAVEYGEMLDLLSNMKATGRK